MALNIKTLGVRSLSAAVFVVLLLGAVLWNYLSFTIFFFIVSMGALHEFYNMSKKNGTHAMTLPGFTFGIATYLAFVNWPFSDTLDFLAFEILAFKIVLFVAAFLILAAGMLAKRENSIRAAVYTIAGVIYAVVPFALLNQMCFQNEGEGNTYRPAIVLGTIFLIWSNDTFAYLGGSLIGKHKMIERISPGKTWEGTIIGVILTFGLSFCFDTLLMPLDHHLWSILGASVPVLATVGDLVESKMKREAGVKDSGNIMPGHGGILDRFDSLIFVAPFLYSIVMLIRL